LDYLIIGLFAVVCIAFFIYNAVVTMREDRRLARGAAEYSIMAFKALDQYMLEVEAMKAGKLQKTTPINGIEGSFWLESNDGKTIVQHWTTRDGSHMNQQLSPGADLIKNATIRLFAP